MFKSPKPSRCAVIHLKITSYLVDSEDGLTFLHNTMLSRSWVHSVWLLLHLGVYVIFTCFNAFCPIKHQKLANSLHWNTDRLFFLLLVFNSFQNNIRIKFLSKSLLHFFFKMVQLTSYPVLSELSCSDCLFFQSSSERLTNTHNPFKKLNVSVVSSRRHYSAPQELIHQSIFTYFINK